VADLLDAIGTLSAGQLDALRQALAVVAAPQWEPSGDGRWIRPGGWLAVRGGRMAELHLVGDSAAVHLYVPRQVPDPDLPATGSPLDGHVCVATQDVPVPVGDDSAWMVLSQAA
jgi:hypothetical protein